MVSGATAQNASGLKEMGNEASVAKEEVAAADEAVQMAAALATAALEA